MRVRIDRDRCQGHGRCYGLAPSLFEPDDLGDGYVIGDGVVSADHRAEAQLAVDTCPEQAISLGEDPRDG